jgi:ABC-type lipoprotein release transport system permease subunit
VYYFTREIRANVKHEGQVIKGIVPDTDLIMIFDEDRNRIYAPEDGILLEQHTAEPLGVSAGDMVMIGDVPVRVAQVSLEHDDRFQYMALDKTEILGTPDMYSVICNVDKENEIPLMEFLSGEDSHIYTAFTANLYDGVAVWFEALDICVVITILFAVVIGSVVVMNTILTNLQDQKREISVLRTLGFQHLSLSARLMIQAAVYYILACIIGIPVGIVVTKNILKTVEQKTRSYPLVHDIRIYLLTMFIVMAYMVISHFYSMQSIRKWNMAENVKAKE